MMGAWNRAVLDRCFKSCSVRRLQAFYAVPPTILISVALRSTFLGHDPGHVIEADMKYHGASYVSCTPGCTCHSREKYWLRAPHPNTSTIDRALIGTGYLAGSRCKAELQSRMYIFIAQGVGLRDKVWRNAGSLTATLWLKGSVLSRATHIRPPCERLVSLTSCAHFACKGERQQLASESGSWRGSSGFRIRNCNLGTSTVVVTYKLLRKLLQCNAFIRSIDMKPPIFAGKSTAYRCVSCLVAFTNHTF
jgi:hypothetical protein